MILNDYKHILNNRIINYKAKLKIVYSYVSDGLNVNLCGCNDCSERRQ